MKNEFLPKTNMKWDKEGQLSQFGCTNVNLKARTLRYSTHEKNHIPFFKLPEYPSLFLYSFINNNTFFFILFHSSTNYPILSPLLVATISYLTNIHVGMFFLFFQLTFSLTHVCLFVVVCDFYVFLNMDLVIIIVFYICRDFLVFYEAC